MNPDPVPRSSSPRALNAVVAIAVVAMWLLLHAWGLGKAPFHTKGEPREAVVVADIVQHGRWILPLRNGVELPAKPPLFHWLGAVASLLLGGVSEYAIRLPSAVLSGAATLLLFVCTATLYGALAGVIAALSLLTSFEWLRAATSARVDMTLAFGLTLSFLGLMMRRVSPRAIWLVFFHAGIAWGALAKGPVAVALPLLQVLLLCAVDRSTALARDLRLARGLICALLVVATWYALAAIEGGQAFIAKQVLDENVYRFLGSARLTGGHRHSVGYLAGSLVLGLLPWTVLIPSAAAALWSQRRTLSRRDPRLFAAIWAMLVFAFYGLPASKRGVYLLPLYPAVSLLLGCWGADLISGAARNRRLSAMLAVLGWALAGVLGSLALVLALTTVGFPLASVIAGFAQGRDADTIAQVASALAKHPLVPILFLVASLCSVAIGLGARSMRWAVALCGIFGATAAATMAVRQAILPEIAREQTRQRFASALRQRSLDPGSVHTLPRFDYGFVFYWGGSAPVWRAVLTSEAPQYLVVLESQWSAFDAAAKRLYERIPDLESRRGGNLGRLLVAQRVIRPLPEPPSGGAAP